jgi:hypothetical protein
MSMPTFLPTFLKRPSAQFALLAILFAGPLIAAFWLYYGAESLQPSGRTNHGVLLNPIVDLAEVATNPAWAEANRDHWVLLYVNDGDCDNACREALYTLRQSRLMLGQDMDRLARVFLHGEAPPDRVFVEEQHQGLVTLEDRPLRRELEASRPSGPAAGGYYLVDPLGNLVMYFPPDIVPGDMVDDIEHLLELSRIG